MLPFSQTVLLWRLERGLTQAELAQRARMARPNLSAIERGKREVSLGTLRALAVSLNVRPGVLADGLPPRASSKVPRRLSRESLERIADAVVYRTSVRDRDERVLAKLAGQIVKHRTAASRRRWARPHRGKRRAEMAWVRLESVYPPAVVRSLMQRILDRQQTG